MNEQAIKKCYEVKVRLGCGVWVSQFSREDTPNILLPGFPASPTIVDT